MSTAKKNFILHMPKIKARINDPDFYFYVYKPGVYVQVTDEDHFLYGYKGKVMKLKDDSFKLLHPGLRNRSIAVDFGRIAHGNRAGKRVTTNDLFGTINKATGYFMLPHELSQA